MQCKVTTSLEKIFDDAGSPVFPVIERDVAAKGEVYSFQIVLTGEPGWYRVVLDGALNARIRTVDSVPVRLAADNEEPYFLRTAPGLYPDLLNRLEDGDSFRILPRQPRVLWVTVPVPEDCVPGEYELGFSFFSRQGEELCARCAFTLQTVDVTLPPQELIRYEWFHSDCLAAYYGVESWSENTGRSSKLLPGMRFVTESTRFTRRSGRRRSTPKSAPNGRPASCWRSATIRQPAVTPSISIGSGAFSRWENGLVFAASA